MKRTPAVAGQFYPAGKGALLENLSRLVPEIPSAEKKQALAVVSPHAGYIYSGSVAGETLARVAIPEDVLLMGPNHHGYGAAVALASGTWSMPLGDVAVNNELADMLAGRSSIIEFDDLAHRPEHSLEVQLPFLQFLQEKLAVIPLLISHLPYRVCAEIGRDIAAVIRSYNKPVLMVASTDMSHYESRPAASVKDMAAIERIMALDPEGLYQTVIGGRISMCGVMPTTVALVAAIELGARQAELVRYTDSGESSGDTSRVVGYAGLVVT